MDFHGKGDDDTCGKCWCFAEEETTNLQLVQSSPTLLLIFKSHPFATFF
jgi:hypothetical protein